MSTALLEKAADGELAENDERIARVVEEHPGLFGRRNSCGQTFGHLLASRGCTQCISVMRDLRPDLIGREDAFGNTPKDLNPQVFAQQQGEELAESVTPDEGGDIVDFNFTE